MTFKFKKCLTCNQQFHLHYKPEINKNKKVDYCSLKKLNLHLHLEPRRNYGATSYSAFKTDSKMISIKI